MAQTNFLISVKNLSKMMGKNKAVNGISLQVRRGEIFGFLGPNGSGKTTTIRMLCGLLTPDSGSGTCLGFDLLTEAQEIKKYLGYVPQHFSLYKALTVYENIELLAQLNEVFNTKEKTQEIIEKLGLSFCKNQLAGTLSGGWKQRLSLACAMVHEPFLLLLDEPTASMDPQARSEFWKIMHAATQEGMTILLSSHNIDEIAQSHNIAYIYNGRLLLQGKIKEVIAHVNLSSWRVSGPNLALLAKQLMATPGIDQILSFFDTLQVSSKDSMRLALALEPFLKLSSYKWEPYESTLDDVIMWLSVHNKSVALDKNLVDEGT